MTYFQYHYGVYPHVFHLSSRLAYHRRGRFLPLARLTGSAWPDFERDRGGRG